jgi:hypothetical protein
MTPYRTHAASAVRLIEHHGDVRSGTLGHVIGRLCQENPTYLVSFVNEGVVEVRGDQLLRAA